MTDRPTDRLRRLRRGPVVPGNRWDTVDAVRRDWPLVSVVVTHYEQPLELARTLEALSRQTYPADRLEIVVSDDGSRVAPVVPAGVRALTQRHDGFGAARARNRAAAVARGDVLVFLDADTTPESTYVERLTRLPAVLPEAVVVGRRRHADLAALSPEAVVAEAAPSVELAEPEWLRRGYAATRDLLYADETSFRHVIASVVGCTAAFFAETGGFDESFTAYGGEDWEWAHRAWTHGGLLAHEPAAVAWHDGSERGQRPGWDSVGAEGRRRLLVESLAVADRVPVPGVVARGLLGGARDPVVTLDADLLGDALVITVDDLLAALPGAAVLVTPAQADVLPADPRVETCPGASTVSPPRARAARSAWRHLHVASPVTGTRADWTAGAEPLRGPEGAGWVEVPGAGGGPALVWSTLRAERRRQRWGRDLDPRLCVPAAGLRPVPDSATVQRHWGGW